MRTSLLLVALAFCGCSDDGPRAPLSHSGGGSHDVQVIHRDSGRSDQEEDDAGERPDAASDAPMPRECVRVDPVRATSDERSTVTSTASPADFLVSRQAATWRNGCDSPTLVVELSNGACPNGDGHELEILLSANAIKDGQIGLGLNPIQADKDSMEGIRVRYTRPDRYAPVGVFGSCEGATGQISFYDAPDVSRTMSLRATYDFMLTPCDGKNSGRTQMVVGFFDVLVRRSLSSVCP
ncbi:MAG TPA: hypothetical protein VJV78_46070 [Polyangiales bacterium]|nr:hypothetical protein [Polyangiales bacterium]